MKGTFLEIALLFIITCLVGSFLYQSEDKSEKIEVSEITNNRRPVENFKNEEFMPVIVDGRVLGPSMNFHQKFKHKLPELGWRNWWKLNKNKNHIVPDSNFHGTSVRQYLNNLDNVKNLYMGQ